MRSLYLALVSVAVVSAAAADDLGAKLARDACIAEQLYYLSAADNAAFSGTIEGFYQVDGNTVRGFHHSGAGGTYCTRKTTAPAKCEQASVMHVQNALGLNGPWVSSTRC